LISRGAVGVGVSVSATGAGATGAGATTTGSTTGCALPVLGAIALGGSCCPAGAGLGPGLSPAEPVSAGAV